MPVLRFPNPVSDIARFRSTFGSVYATIGEESSFDHDDIARALATEGHASSRGATGTEALRRSTEKDRSRDPLFNQAKQYSELFRILGWAHPDGSKGQFRFTHLAGYVADADPVAQRTIVGQLVELCLLCLVVPSPHLTNSTTASLRPMLLILEIAAGCDGRIHRDEIIAFVLGADGVIRSDDVPAICSLVRAARAARSLLDRLTAVADGRQVNTLKNYTRFPIGVMKSAGWFDGAPDKSPYKGSPSWFALTDQGSRLVKSLSGMRDVRPTDLRGHDRSQVANLGFASHYRMLERCGYPIDEVVSDVLAAEAAAASLLGELGVKNAGEILFSPYQQLTPDLISTMESLGS